MNLGISLLRNPTPELIAVIMDEARPLAERWHAYCVADEFDPKDYQALAAMDPAYVRGELARICKAVKEAKPTP
jgi:hypothetical protein